MKRIITISTDWKSDVSRLSKKIRPWVSLTIIICPIEKLDPTYDKMFLEYLDA